jgi:hypothetical protein
MLPSDRMSQLWMRYACVPCICFDAVTINRTDLCFKQLGLVKEDLCDRLPRFKKTRTKQQSKHKGKDWRSFNKVYTDYNNKWRRRNISIVKRDFQFDGQLINDSQDEMQDHNSGIIISYIFANHFFIIIFF